MSKAKKIFLLNERRETWRIKLREQRTAYCPACNADTEWLTSRDSMRLLNSNELAVLKLVDAVDVHSQEDDRGFLLFCRISLEKFAQREMEHEED